MKIYVAGMMFAVAVAIVIAVAVAIEMRSVFAQFDQILTQPLRHALGLP